MASAINRLIKNLSEKSLKTYFSGGGGGGGGGHSGIAEKIDWDAGEREIREALEISSTLSSNSLAVLSSYSERIDALTDELGQIILKHFVKDDELDD